MQLEINALSCELFCKIIRLFKSFSKSQNFYKSSIQKSKHEVWQPLSYHPYLVLNVNHICMCWIQALIHSPVPKLYIYIFPKLYLDYTTYQILCWTLEMEDKSDHETLDM